MRSLFFIFALLVSTFSIASNLILADQVKIKSNILGGERQLLIHFPKQYSDNSNVYPVLYVLHGQWDMLSTISTIDLLEDQIPNFIVVGVESRGQELYPDDGKLTPFAKYLINEVVPYINQSYRTAPYSILSGHSNSGRFVLDFWLNQKSTFSQYFAFSPSLDDGYIVDKASKSKQLQNKAPLVVTIANEGEHMQKPFVKLSQQLNHVSENLFKFKKFPSQSHRTTKHSSMQYALQQTFTGWEPSYEVKISGLDGLKRHYTELSKKFGFKVIVPNETLQKLTAHYAISDSKNAQNELRKHIAFSIKQTPDGLDSVFEIADYLSENGYKSASRKIFNELCNLIKSNKKCNT